MPELFLKREWCITEGRLEEAKEWQFRVNEIIVELLSLPSLYGGCKAVLKLNGLDCGEPRLPLLPVPESYRRQIADINDKIVQYVRLCEKK